MLSYDVTKRVTKRQLDLLEPYLIGEGPRQNGEWDMYCPLHEDVNRSASLNIYKGMWICNRGCGAGAVAGLIKKRKEWVEPSAPGSNSGGGSLSRPKIVPTESMVREWCDALLSNRTALREFEKQRGISKECIERFQIGWSQAEGCYTIPVRNPEGGFWNVRKYQLNPGEGRRKIWSIDGLGTPRLFPLGILDDDPEEVIICEGELDALIAIQNGFHAITRTGAAKVWNASWNELFRGKIVYLAHDADETGVAANNAISAQMRKVALEVRRIVWPYPIMEKHGKDLTDFLKEHSADDLRKLMRESEVEWSAGGASDVDPPDVGFTDTFDSRSVGKPIRITATIKGKQEPGYSIPRRATLRCTMDKAPSKCNACPLYGAKGVASVIIDEHDPVCLELADSTRVQMVNILREKYGAQPCDRIEADIEEHQAIEILHARESVDQVRGRGGSGEYKTRRITSVGRHNTQPNTTVKIVGALQPDPRRQKNEFQAWAVEPIETSLDTFKVDEELARRLMKFQPRKGQSPLAKRVKIARDLSQHVTKIYGRDEMHVAMDLVFHSVLRFTFDGQDVERGWVELLVIGDTRTGKSEVATKLCSHYQVGESVSCESASFAGIVGGLQQYGSSGEWSVNWGIIPVNDRRLVVLDEAGELSTEEIGQLAGVRSSGIAKLTKIQQDETNARTRLIWLMNPRNGRLDSFTYGVDAIGPAIGNPEDIARFDLAMSAKFDASLAGEINRKRKLGSFHYSSEDCHALVMWCWSRRPDQIKFTPKAERAVYEAARDLGSRYTEDPPLIQVANVRIKVSRLAASLAGSVFSTDETYENIIVKEAHVKDVVRLIDALYGMKEFGYKDRSAEAIADAKFALKSSKKTKAFLLDREGLVKYLRGSSKFKRQDIEEVLNCDRREANAIINKLHEYRMIKKEGGFVMVTPALHDLLRETDGS